MFNNEWEKNSKEVCAVIIGFQYQKEYYIPGILIDMFRTYQFLKRNNPKIQILVITDISHDLKDERFVSSIAKKNCGAGIYSFISDLQSRGEHQYWISPQYLEHAITIHCQKAERLFVYYSGHAVQREFLLPNFEKVSSLSFQNWFYRVLEPKAQILFFFDCCNTSNLQLPYLLTMDYSVSRYRSSAVKKGGIYHFHNIRALKDMNPVILEKGLEVICLCSSMEDEDSMATWTGSTFTQLFFSVLEGEEGVIRFEGKQCRNIHKILKEIQKVLRSKQACRAYASHPHLVVLPPWLFEPKIHHITYSDHGICVHFSS